MRVPVLVLDDGRPMFESNAIIDYLAEGTPYMPAGSRMTASRRLRGSSSSSTRSSPTWPWRGSSRSSTSSRPRVCGGRSRRAAARVSRRSSAASTGKEFLVGDSYSVADISVYAYTHVAQEGEFDLTPYPWIQAWLERVATRPGHIKITD